MCERSPGENNGPSNISVLRIVFLVPNVFLECLLECLKILVFSEPGTPSRPNNHPLADDVENFVTL